MKIMSLTDNEIFYINLEYNSKELYESFIDLPIGFLENLPAQYISTSNNVKTIRQFKTALQS